MTVQNELQLTKNQMEFELVIILIQKIWHVVLASNASTQIIQWLNYLWKKH